jgi:hypothetical protein
VNDTRLDQIISLTEDARRLAREIHDEIRYLDDEFDNRLTLINIRITLGYAIRATKRLQGH